MPRARPGSERLTIGDVLAYFAPSLARRGELPEWPPDAFALAAGLLKKADAYAAIVRRGAIGNRASARRRVERLGRRWRRSAARGEPAPAELRELWRTVSSIRRMPIETLFEREELSSALLTICSAADEASAYAGVGIDGRFDDFGEQCLIRLLASESQTLCRAIDPSRAVVLPKGHTAQVGLTLRSISHHLAFWESTEVKPKWSWAMGESPRAGLNVLFLPWPMELWPSHFVASRKAKADPNAVHGYFSCERFLGIDELVPSVGALVRKAEARVGRVDAVLFPELALEAGATYALCEALNQGRANPIFVVAGEGARSTRSSLGRNEAAVAFWQDEFISPWSQSKHHRWKLDRGQITTYGLGAQLDPTCNWWEDIEIPQRRLNVWALDDWLTFSVLICEDLARQEPVGELLRTIGPTLVIALLMDGPQLETRWPARYASVLADDPGSSVLTVTSLGMTRLSRVAGKPPSRVVALWKEPGRSVELELPSGADGLMLCFTRDRFSELTADGRTQAKQSGVLRLNGIHPL